MFKAAQAYGGDDASATLVCYSGREIGFGDPHTHAALDDRRIDR